MKCKGRKHYETTSNGKAFAQKKKPAPKQKGNQSNESSYLQIIPLIRSQYPKYGIERSHTPVLPAKMEV